MTEHEQAIYDLACESLKVHEALATRCGARSVFQAVRDDEEAARLFNTLTQIDGRLEVQMCGERAHLFSHGPDSILAVYEGSSDIIVEVCPLLRPAMVPA